MNALEIRGFLHPLTPTPTVDAWIGGDLFVSLQNLLRGQIGRSLLCEYFQIDPQELEEWTALSGLQTQGATLLKDFYLHKRRVVCAWNEVEFYISDDQLSKTTAGKHILLNEGRKTEDGGICCCFS